MYACRHEPSRDNPKHRRLLPILIVGATLLGIVTGWAPAAARRGDSRTHRVLRVDGVPLGILLDEAGIAPGASWLLAEGADAAVASPIAPDGSGLPSGRGTVAQGAILFEEKCEACHGPAGSGGAADRLTGGVGSLASSHPIKTVVSYWPFATTLFDYVRRAMPTPRPESLSNDEVYALCAYLLSVDHIVAADATLNATTLPKVRMPNRDGFVPLWPSDKAR